MSGACTVGIDFGGTKIDVGIVDAKGKVLTREVFSTDTSSGNQALLQKIGRTIKSLQKDLSVSLLAAGVGIAGQIEKHTGLLHFAPNIPGWSEFPLKEKLSQEISMPVFVTNDVRAATWGEWLYGSGKGSSDLVCVFVGTGIGGGVVMNGNMMEGSTNSAGELGHFPIDFRGPPCTCGNIGCFEAIASGWAIARKAKEIAIKNPSFAEALQDRFTAKSLFEAYHKKNPHAESIVTEVQEALAAGFSGIVNAFNPDKLILGGGIIENNPFLFEYISQAVPRKALKVAVKSLKIVKAQLGADSGVIGAAAYARKIVEMGC